MILLTIRALNGRGRYMLKAKTWAYMSTGTGPLINGIPLILAGLTVTAIVTILPIIYVPGPYTADIVVFPTLENSISCWENNTISLYPFCSALDVAGSLIGSYQDFGSIYGSVSSTMNPKVGIVSSTNNTMGFPYLLIANRKALTDKYDAGAYSDNATLARHLSRSQSPRSTCIWALSSNPMVCEWVSGTESNSVLTIVSPYTYHAYRSQLRGNTYQNGFYNEINGTIELVMFQTSVFAIQDGYPHASGFVCKLRSGEDIYTATTAVYTDGRADSLIPLDGYPNSTCEPYYQPLNHTQMFNITGEMLAAVYKYSGVNKFNQLIDSFYTYNQDLIPKQFADSTTMLEDGMSVFMSLMMSISYGVAEGTYSIPSYTTTVYGGPLDITLGLSKYSPFQIWYIIIIIPLITMFIGIFCPKSYVPQWDIMNPVEALVAQSDMNTVTTGLKDRTKAARLSKVDGKVIATNKPDLPSINQ
jgi:hypothetical protein